MSANATLFDIMKNSFAVTDPNLACPVTDKVAADESVVGEVPAELRSMFAALITIGHETTALYKQAPERPTLVQKAMFIEKARPLLHLAETTGDTFWTALKSVYPLSDEYNSIGIRAGWKVVHFNKEEDTGESDDLGDMLATMLQCIPGVRVYRQTR